MGQKIKSVKDVAYLGQVYRNPQYETFRIVFLNEKNEVVAQTGISSRLPGASAVSIDPSDREKSFKHFNDIKEKSKATQYYLLHNHPSGQVEMSEADFRTTKIFSKEISGFKGHVIINHKKYNSIEESQLDDNKIADNIKELNTKEKEDILRKKSDKDAFYFDFKINGPSDFAEYSKTKALYVSGRDGVSVIGAGSIGVNGITSFDIDQLKNAEEDIKNFSVYTGSNQLFVSGYFDFENNIENRRIVEKMYRNNLITDAYDFETKQRLTDITFVQPDPRKVLGVNVSEKAPIVSEKMKKTISYNKVANKYIKIKKRDL